MLMLLYFKTWAAMAAKDCELSRLGKNLSKELKQLAPNEGSVFYTNH